MTEHVCGLGGRKSASHVGSCYRLLAYCTVGFILIRLRDFGVPGSDADGHFRKVFMRRVQLVYL